jgi:carbonic anhydrase
MPPCSDGVWWMVIKDLSAASKKQIDGWYCIDSIVQQVYRRIVNVDFGIDFFLCSDNTENY